MTTTTTTPPCDHYRGSRIAVGTRHGKQHQFARPFRQVLDAVLVTPRDLDTDRFGTFTGETPREGSAIDAARAKAELAMTATGLPLGLASEASYGPLPGSDWPGHEEILLFRDAQSGIEVIEGLRDAGVPGRAHTLSPGSEVPSALLAGLPGQALIVRPHRPAPGSAPTPAAGILKGLTDSAALPAAVRAAAELSADGLAVVEPDLRAHHNPSRRKILAQLAESLAHRLATSCPACGAPGFGRVGSVAGLPCRVCATPTSVVAAELQACCSCPHQITVPVPAPADPGLCTQCNP